MAKLNWTDEAVRWLEDIFEFIAVDNPEAARRTVQAIYDRVQMLEAFPELGFRYEKIQDRNVRIYLYGHYKIAYCINPNGSIDILGVFHGALDISRYLF